MGDASLGGERFSTDEVDEAARIIAELNRLNELRQAEEQSILDEAIKMVEKLDIEGKHAILLASDKWNSGVIGIAASRLTELYHRPTILFSEHDGALKGSARSVEGINIHDALKANSELFIRFGGHAKAAGVTMEKGKFREFTEALENYLAENCPPDLFVPRKCYEFDEEFSEITMTLTKQLDMLAPFGEGNPCPVFHVSNVSPYHIRRFGSDGAHLKMDLRRDRYMFESVYFCGGRSFESIMRAESISLLYSPFVNNWNGSENLQMRIISVRPDLPRCASRFIKSNMSRFYEAFLSDYGVFEPSDDAPEPFAGSVAEAVKTSFAGLMVLAFSTDGAEEALRELSKEGVENFEVCFGTVPDGVFSGNVLLLAPIISKLPRRGYNRILFFDEPYDSGVYAEVRRIYPEARLLSAGRASDLADLLSGFSISREEMALYYRSVASLLSSDGGFSATELSSRLSDLLSRPAYQTEFVLRVFAELGFITRDGKAVRLRDAGRRALSESRIYAAVSGSQCE